MNKLAQRDLFGTPVLPEGMHYFEEFLSESDEIGLLDVIATLPFDHSRYRQYTAKRRTVSYGFSYDFTDRALRPAEHIPEFLHPLRQRVATQAQLDAEQFVQALVTEYEPGTALGWHRDVPQFETVVGLSLANPCRMRMRPYPPRANKRDGVIALALQPRSMYILRDAARWAWQHSIPPTKALRYSITFRTLR
ncbi:MAG: alpha-ketoglutarate-dependent dioxygenase AlkB [Steroidobacteraceae bacterium]